MNKAGNSYPAGTGGVKDRGTNKLCPFMTSGKHKVCCTPACMFYRHKKPKGYECPFVELGPMSWAVGEISRQGNPPNHSAGQY